MGKWKDYKVNGEHVKDIHKRVANAIKDLPYAANLAEISIAFSMILRASKIEKET